MLTIPLDRPICAYLLPPQPPSRSRVDSRSLPSPSLQRPSACPHIGTYENTAGERAELFRTKPASTSPNTGSCTVHPGARVCKSCGPLLVDIEAARSQPPATTKGYTTARVVEKNALLLLLPPPVPKIPLPRAPSFVLNKRHFCWIAQRETRRCVNRALFAGHRSGFTPFPCPEAYPS